MTKAAFKTIQNIVADFKMLYFVNTADISVTLRWMAILSYLRLG